MITKEELHEILRESPLYCCVSEAELKIIVENLHPYISADNPGINLARPNSIQADMFTNGML